MARYAPNDSVMTVEEFKEMVLRVAVLDEPWDTQLVWSDAQGDLSDLDEAQRDAAVIDVLLDLHDEGLVEYFAVTSYSPDDYERDPAPWELLPREALRDQLTVGETTLRLRPTQAARLRYSPEGH
jgi:hypothetical protein